MPENETPISFVDAPVPGEGEPIAADRVVAGAPTQKSLNLYESPDGKFFAGLWDSTPGAWRVQYDEDEYCRILRGRLRLTPDGGAAVDYAAGDSFLIPRGFRGVWETLEPVRKIYVIYG